MTHWIPYVLFAMLILGLITTGCKPSDVPNAETTQASAPPADEAHPPPISAEDVERPASFRDALPRIETYRDVIRDFIAAGKPHATHRPLDELDFVLSWLPELAQESDVPRTSWEAINTTAQEIRQLFNKIHARLDENEPANYAEISDDVDRAIARLRQIANSDGETGKSRKTGKSGETGGTKP